ncbi:hypothetical protein K488DRAFT_88981 [Vararia minispora EC-137]|uniref:Uncharacterized protein n=1 Tax=Vararia minispora EC-137 TaxID=1314806 RepID=A0ACB8QC32_9AGAM|nr:hypothetical protein K488DRAFT_88981 [Vararia minispora EC-137]
MSFSYWQNALEPRISRVTDAKDPDDPYKSAPLARMTLEMEERAIRSILSRVRAELNTLLPVNRLPSSILQRIFLFLAAEEPVPNESWMMHDRNSKHWTKVTYVCSSWRRAALRCPALWVSPPLVLGSWRFYAFIGRSMDEPLSLYLDDMGELSHQLLATALAENLARVRVIDVSVVVGEPVLATLAQPAPLLEVLRIFPSKGAQEFPEVPLMDMGTLFAHQAPRLHTLVLRGFTSFPLQPAIFENIRTLHIAHRHIEDLLRLPDTGQTEKAVPNAELLEAGPDATTVQPTWHAPDPEEFILTLASIRHLEDLSLDGCLPQLWKSAGTPVDLRHLRRLSVSGRFLVCVWFFENARVPPTCRVRILAPSPGNGTADTPRMIMALRLSGYLEQDGRDTPSPEGANGAAPPDATDGATDEGAASGPGNDVPVESGNDTDLEMLTDLALTDRDSNADSGSSTDDAPAFFRSMRLLTWSSKTHHILHIGTWRSTPHTPPPLTSPADLTLELVATPPRPHYTTAVIPLHHLALPLSKLRALHTAPTLFADSHPLCWRAALGACPALHELHASGPSGKDLLAALAPRAGFPPPTSTAPRAQLAHMPVSGPSGAERRIAEADDLAELARADAPRTRTRILFPRLCVLTLRDVDLEADYGRGQMAVGWKVLLRTLLARRRSAGRGGGGLERVRLGPKGAFDGEAERYWVERVEAETGVIIEEAGEESEEEAVRWEEIRREIALPRKD